MGSSLGLDDGVSSASQRKLQPGDRGTIRNHCRFVSRENQNLVSPRWADEG